MRITRKRLAGILAVAIGLIVITSACDTFNDYATSTSDTHICVFDGSKRGGEKLKFQIAPGARSKHVDNNDQVVKIPASNRFWSVTSDRNIADPGTPNYYTGNASGGVPVVVQGQIRFKFNLDLACEWYSKHGRRNAGSNGDLGFNVRNDPNAGWFRFLNENFTPTMQEVVSETMSEYSWDYLHYNFPQNANNAGLVPAGEKPATPTRVALGAELGSRFTTLLRKNLGDDYFCGVSSTPQNPCAGIEFQVFYAGPGDNSQLVKDRAEVENTKQKIQSDALEGQLQQQNLEQQLAAENAKGRILELQQQNAAKQAQIDNAKCLALANAGLDCSGNRPQPILH